MRRLFMIVIMLIGSIAIGQVFSSSSRVDMFGNVITVYTDDFGFQLGSSESIEGLFDSVRTVYKDNFGFVKGYSVGNYSIDGSYDVDYDFTNYGLPQLDLELPRLDLSLPVLIFTKDSLGW